jgi:hypothetical protein
MSSQPSYLHKALYILCVIVLGIVMLNVCLSLFVAGIRIMLFAMKMIVLPVLVVAFLYVLWHARRFWR